jgi:hypothetical protein
MCLVLELTEELTLYANEHVRERLLTTTYAHSLFSTSISFLIRSPGLIKSKKQKPTSVCLEPGELRLDRETPWACRGAVGD